MWAQAPVTLTPMHVGDICNLGIFCVSPASNRNLLDFIFETISPTTGCAHVAFADDNKVGKLRVANQISGQNILGLRSGPCADHGALPTSRPSPSAPAPVLSTPALPVLTANPATDLPKRL